VVLSVEKEALGTGGAISLARPYLTGEGPVLVLNGDLISSVDVAALATHHESSGAMVTLSLWEIEDPSRFGVCELDDAGFIRRFQEKPERGTEFSNLINAGCYLIERDVLAGLASEPHSIEREVFPRIAEAGKMSGLVFTGYFVDAGTSASFIEAAQVCISNGRYNSGQVNGDSWLGDNSHCGGSLSGSSIGAGSNVGADASLTDCVVLAGANIGAGASLTRCLVGEGAVVAAGAELSDTIVGHHAHVE